VESMVLTLERSNELCVGVHNVYMLWVGVFGVLGKSNVGSTRVCAESLPVLGISVHGVKHQAGTR
jgi:hypothetical protein